MDPQNVYSVMTKDFSTFIKKKYVLFTSFALPLALSIGLPVVLFVAKNRAKNQGVLPAVFERLIPSFSFFFVILSAMAPVMIAGYSLVGEKLEKSLEPLLATPLSDSEILLGKSLVAVIPSLISIYTGSVIFSISINSVTDYVYLLPDTLFLYVLLLVIPLVVIFSVEIMVIISSRVNDVRTSTQIGMFMMAPFIGIYLLSETGYVTLDTNMMLQIAGVLAIIDIIIFNIAKLTFQREEILTKWK